METKVCSQCGEEKPATDEYFVKQKRGMNGSCASCKECGKVYRETNKASKREYNKQYYELNKDEIDKYKKQWKELNKNKIEEMNRRYYGLNKDKISNKCNQWAKSNRDTKNMYIHNYRSKKKLLPCTLTIIEWESIKQHFNNSCCYCGKELPLAQEHFIPLNKNGEYTNNNIIPACKSCNSSKSSRDFSEWYPKCKYYSKKREKKILDFLNYKDNVQQLSVIL